MEYRIGCSGYFYPQWKNLLYPPGLPPSKWLAHYSSIFNTVELNGTFYRMPKINDLKKYYAQTPASFSFSVKMSRYITHTRRLKQKQPVLDFQNLVLDGLGDKVGHFLFQLPPNFAFSDENLARVVECVPESVKSVVEFRHQSWWNSITTRALQQVNITFCHVDFPGLITYPILTSSAFYMRLHGNPELFKSSYSKEDLQRIQASFPDTADTCTVYFNNTITEAGYKNAISMSEIVNAAIWNG